MASKDLRQVELPIGRRAQPVPVDASIVFRQPSKLAAINLCIQASGLEDKEIYGPLGIDPGQWSRIRKGDAHFPTNLENQLMDICGNEIPLEWIAHSRGKKLEPILSTLEAKLAESEAKCATLQNELAVITNFVRRTGRAA